MLDSQPTVAWPPTTVSWLFSDFFEIFSEMLGTLKKVVWQSANGRVTSDDRRVTVQRLFSKKFWLAWNVEKNVFECRPTVAWPPTTVAWPFSDFSQIFSKLNKTSKEISWQLADGLITDHYRVTVQQFFSKFLQIAWNVQKTLFDSRSRDLRPLSRDRSATFNKKFPNCLKRR